MLTEKSNIRGFDSSLEIVEKQSSQDGNIQKYVFESKEKKGLFEMGSFFSEAKQKHDVCISTMAGCNMGCEICAISRSEKPFERKLTTPELLGQIQKSFQERYALFTTKTTHEVGFMGNGEPFGNFENVIQTLEELNLLTSPVNEVILSTTGVHLNKLFSLAEFQKHSNLLIHLQYSLISVQEEIRKKLIPRSEPLSSAIRVLDLYSELTGQPVKYNLPLIVGINDTRTQLKQLIQFAKAEPKKRKLKISTFNHFPGTNFLPSSREKIEEVFKTLRNENIETQLFIADQDENVKASCGQLRSK